VRAARCINLAFSLLQLKSPEVTANYLSRLTFWWFNSILITGYKRPLEESDLYPLNEVDKAGSWVPAFEKQWRKEMVHHIRSLFVQYSEMILQLIEPVL